MTFDEALKEIEILKLQNKKMGETFDSLDKKIRFTEIGIRTCTSVSQRKVRRI